MSTMTAPRPLEDEWIGAPEIADMLDVTTPAVRTWRFREQKDKPKMPPPDDHIGAMPIWRLDTLLPWFKQTGRPFDAEKWRAKKAAGGYLHTGKFAEINARRASKPSTSS